MDFVSLRIVLGSLQMALARGMGGLLGCSGYLAAALRCPLHLRLPPVIIFVAGLAVPIIVERTPQHRVWSRGEVALQNNATQHYLATPRLPHHGCVVQPHGAKLTKGLTHLTSPIPTYGGTALMASPFAAHCLPWPHCIIIPATVKGIARKMPRTLSRACAIVSHRFWGGKEVLQVT